MRISDGSSDVCSSDLGRASGGNACITSRCKRGCDRPGVHRNDRFRGTRKPHFFLQEGKRKKLALNDSECQYSPYQWLRTKNRSEEHTSELQSLMRISYAVFCLKKKKTYLSFVLNY